MDKVRTFDEIFKAACDERYRILLDHGNVEDGELSLSAAEWQVVGNHPVSRERHAGMLDGIKLVLKLTDEEARVMHNDALSSAIAGAKAA